MFCLYTSILASIPSMATEFCLSKTFTPTNEASAIQKAGMNTATDTYPHRYTTATATATTNNRISAVMIYFTFALRL